MSELTRVIKSKQAYFGITNKKISKILNQTEKTVSKHINNPGLMSLQELKCYIKLLHLDAESISTFLCG